jgi:hypothetical protein
MNTKSREARGLHSELCRQCKTGLSFGAIKLFDLRCEGCLDKKARGLRTGDEPRTVRRVGEKWVDHARIRKQLSARRKALAATPGPR